MSSPRFEKGPTFGLAEDGGGGGPSKSLKGGENAAHGWPLLYGLQCRGVAASPTSSEAAAAPPAAACGSREVCGGGSHKRELELRLLGMGVDGGTEALPRLAALPRVLFVPVSSVDVFRSGGSTSFTPLFCHHFFPSDEKIVGYDSVCVKVFFTPTTFHVYIQLDGVVSSKATNPKSIENALMQALTKQVPFPGDVCTTPEEFEQKVKESASFKPPGRVRSQVLFPSPASNGSRVLLQIRECVFSSTESGKAFAALHRRVEWFLHWFIESASSIHPDPQWVVLLPYLCYLSDRDLAKASHEPLEKSLRETARKRVQEMRSRADASGCLQRVNSKKAGAGGRGPKREKAAVAATPLAAAADSGVAAATGAHARPGKQETLGAAAVEGRCKREESEKSGAARPPEGPCELAGIITLYTFYALTGYRRRLSQCLVFPHVQSKGIGMRTLEFVYQDIILDPKVIELRDVVCLKLAVDLGIVSPEMLYPSSQGAAASAGLVELEPQQLRAATSSSSLSGVASGGMGSISLHTAPPGVPCAECFRRVLKETKTQAARLTEILALAAVLPEPAPELVQETPVSAGRRDWRPSDGAVGCPDTAQQQTPPHGHEAAAGQGSGGALRRHGLRGTLRAPLAKRAATPCNRGASGGPLYSTAFHRSAQCAAVRQRVKQRLKRESYDLLCELPVQQQKADLDKKWAETYSKYYRTIVKLRRLLGRSPAAAHQEAVQAGGGRSKRQKPGSAGMQ
ncbi:hypothetical protein cyc_07791 [Cyclospora cayetanensis]|uniref:histone acetyltransferase n=1 Tax=Cyclospora cayetanensis TaxID=88456 RepID=A0A1D3CRG9_9EIME|nr:hypothetical protein cyc_07791 [Cyclospora cayetanensis]